MKKGFTLIEVLVALLIFAIVGMLAAQGLQTLIHTHQALKKQSNHLEALQMAEFLIERNLTQIIDRPITDEQNIVQPAVRGNAKSIEFTHGGVANPEGILVKSSLQRTGYFLLHGQLIQRNWAHLDRTPKTPPYDRVLLTNITELQFRYYDAKSQPQILWPPEKTNKTKNPYDQNVIPLPRAIEMTITFGSNNTLSRVFMIPGQTLNASS